MAKLSTINNQAGVYVDSNNNVGIGTTSPNSTLSVVSPTTSATLTNFTQSLSSSGLNIVSTQGAGNVLTPGLFWSSTDNQPTKPKAGVWTKITNAGSYLYFGTSNIYSTGITNTGMVMDYNGNVGIGTTSPSYLMLATKTFTVLIIVVWMTS